MANIGKAHDFTSQKINVNYNGEFLNLSFLEIEKILDDSLVKDGRTFRDSKPFSVSSKNRIITQSGTLSSFAQNFTFFLNQKMYFDENTVFKMNVELGSVKLFNQN